MTDITKSCRDINELSSVAKKACSLFLDECKKANIDIFITETYRSQARQNYLYEQGRTRSGQKVTWTRSSNHTSRMAWDIAVNPPKNLYDEATLKKAGAIAKKLGIEWGGTWAKANLDMPHFQVNKNWKAPGATTASKTPAKTNTTSSPSSTSSKKSDSTITAIQKKMNSRYEIDIESDGFYGKSTKGALIKGFQSELNKQYKAKLKVDGIWGKNTREKSPVITKNTEGNIIYILQAALYCNGCDPKGVDGRFGSGTQSAVKLFQKANGLIRDGIVGLKTWEALFK